LHISPPSRGAPVGDAGPCADDPAPPPSPSTTFTPRDRHGGAGEGRVRRVSDGRRRLSPVSTVDAVGGGGSWSPAFDVDVDRASMIERRVSAMMVGEPRRASEELAEHFFLDSDQ